MAGPDPDVETSELLRQFVAAPDPAFGTREIAEMLDVSRRRADDRLRELQEEGLVASKVVSRDRIWWLTGAGEEYLAGDS